MGRGYSSDWKKRWKEEEAAAAEDGGSEERRRRSEPRHGRDRLSTELDIALVGAATRHQREERVVGTRGRFGVSCVSCPGGLARPGTGTTGHGLFWPIKESGYAVLASCAC